MGPNGVRYREVSLYLEKHIWNTTSSKSSGKHYLRSILDLAFLMSCTWGGWMALGKQDTSIPNTGSSPMAAARPLTSAWKHPKVGGFSCMQKTWKCMVYSAYIPCRGVCFHIADALLHGLGMQQNSWTNEHSTLCRDIPLSSGRW